MWRIGESMIGSYTGRIAPTGKAEDDFDALHLEALHKRLRSGELHRASSHLVGLLWVGPRSCWFRPGDCYVGAGKQNDLPFGEVEAQQRDWRRALGDKYEAAGCGHWRQVLQSRLPLANFSVEAGGSCHAQMSSAVLTAR